jgi:N-acyl-L-homoserine lactone synthetase
MSISLAFRPVQSSIFSKAAPEIGSFSFELRVATSAQEQAEILALRKRAYSAMGYETGPAFEYTDAFDTLPTTVLVGAYDAGKLAGGLRLCFSNPWQTLASLPCASHYPALKDVKRQAQGALMEVSRLSIEPSISNTSYRTTLYASLVRAGFIGAQAANVSKILVATRPDWVRFYQYMLGFEVIGEPAFYPPGDMRITLLGGSLSLAEKRQRLQNRFFRITLEEIASMKTALAPALAPPSACVDAATLTASAG